MVRANPKRRRQRGSLMAEIAVALVIFTTVMVPLVVSFTHDQKEGRDLYLRAIAMEIVDGEMEVLAAGAWREYAPGRHVISVEAGAAVNLPDGEFIFTRGEKFMRLEWVPEERFQKRKVIREVSLP